MSAPLSTSDAPARSTRAASRVLETPTSSDMTAASQATSQSTSTMSGALGPDVFGGFNALSARAAPALNLKEQLEIELLREQLASVKEERSRKEELHRSETAKRARIEVENDEDVPGESLP